MEPEEASEGELGDACDLGSERLGSVGGCGDTAFTRGVGNVAHEVPLQFRALLKGLDRKDMFVVCLHCRVERAGDVRFPSCWQSLHHPHLATPRVGSKLRRLSFHCIVITV
jgi:hypothetical protein